MEQNSEEQGRLEEIDCVKSGNKSVDVAIEVKNRRK